MLELMDKHTSSRQWPAQAIVLWTSMRNKVLNVQVEKQRMKYFSACVPSEMMDENFRIVASPAI